MCIKLCDAMNAHELSQKITQFISQKEQKDLMISSYASKTADRSVLEGRRMLKTAMSATSEKPDLAQYAINAAPS
jgi:hypothetical protein